MARRPAGRGTAVGGPGARWRVRSDGRSARRVRALSRAGAAWAVGCLVLAGTGPAAAAGPSQGVAAPGAAAVPSAPVTPAAVPGAGAASADHAGARPGAEETVHAAEGDERGTAEGDGGATGYRFWSFWTQDDEDDGWRYATEGPGTMRPSDGAVVGFRFAVSGNSGGEEEPREAPDFDAVCGADEVSADERRVALVLDHGTPEDAPDGAEPPEARTVCATLPAGGTVADALAAEAAPLRYDSAGLLCALDGYPAEGCGEEVERGAEESAADGGSEDSSVAGAAGLWLGLAAVAVLAAAALGRSRRRGRP